MGKALGRAVLFAAAALLMAAAGAAAAVDHTPWLAMRLVQDGKPVPLSRRNLRRTEVRLAPRPFRILFPKRDPAIAYQLCAWTEKSVFRDMRPRSLPGDPNAGGEHPCFLPGIGMADTEAGSGMLMLDNGGHNYLIDLRLGPDPEHPAVYYSSLWTRAGGEVPIARARGSIYIVAFQDSDRDGYLDNDEYDFLVLRFAR